MVEYKASLCTILERCRMEYNQRHCSTGVGVPLGRLPFESDRYVFLSISRRELTERTSTYDSLALLHAIFEPEHERIQLDHRQISFNFLVSYKYKTAVNEQSKDKHKLQPPPCTILHRSSRYPDVSSLNLTASFRLSTANVSKTRCSKHSRQARVLNRSSRHVGFRTGFEF